MSTAPVNVPTLDSGSSVMPGSAQLEDSYYDTAEIEVYLQTNDIDQDDVESDDNYDMMAYDDDGEPLEDDEGRALIPYDPTAEYDEDQAIYLMAFANTYREVRGKLQATKIGRDHKVFKKGGGKSSGKRPPHLFKRKSKPSFSRPKKTIFNKKGKGKRGKQSNFVQRIKCFNCGQLGHISRNCPKGNKGKAAGSGKGTSSSNGFFCSGIDLSALDTVSHTSDDYDVYSVPKAASSYGSGSQKKDALHLLRTATVAYHMWFIGLYTAPCHGLVDTGAQDGCIGLWHAQRWIICLHLCFQLQPVWLPMPEIMDAGGIGGSAKTVGLCDMPTGIAGVSTVSRWVILEDPPREERRTPPLIPITLLKRLDAVHDIGRKRLLLRKAKTSTICEEVDSGHQSVSMMNFGKRGFKLKITDLKPGQESPFKAGATHLGAPQDPRLDPQSLISRAEEFVSKEEMAAITNFPKSPMVSTNFLANLTH